MSKNTACPTAPHAKPCTERLSSLLLLAASGGICGGYGVIGFATFACGQTGNLVHMMNDLASGKFISFLLRIGALLLFMAGVAAAAVLPEKLGKAVWQRRCLVLETVLLLLTMLMPSGTYFLVRLAPVFLFSALQYHTFNRFEGLAVATIFCSNNVRQMTLGLTGWLYKRDPSAFHQFKIYAFAILAYASGALFCAVFYDRLGSLVLLPGAGMPLIVYARVRRDAADE